jgi:hypothetical protein
MLQPQQPPISQQPPDDSNTPVQLDALDALTGMADAQLAQFFADSQQTDLPNHLGDVNDITQKFVFAAGLNRKFWMRLNSSSSWPIIIFRRVRSFPAASTAVRCERPPAAQGI